MAVKIRLARGGSKKQPFYQVVVSDERYPRDGRFLENVGKYDPKTDPATVVLKEENIMQWLAKGAQPSETVKQLLRKAGLWVKVKQAESNAG